MSDFARVFGDLGLNLIERGWLSSNNIAFSASHSAPATVVDTGYSLHAEQTTALVSRALGPQRLGRIVNTHLHSDHCGGNARLALDFGCEVWVPEASFDAARDWNVAALTHDETGQRCERFAVEQPLRVGDDVDLGPTRWRVIPVSGHDPDAVMLFEPRSRVLISADALWEDRLAIVFSEVDGASGFADVREALDTIEALQPLIVIPGHGRAFSDVGRALERSRSRLAQFEQEPARHHRYATRALTMFHMMEVQCCLHGELLTWLQVIPIFRRLHSLWKGQRQSIEAFAAEVVDSLVTDRLLLQVGEDIVLVD